MFMPNFGSVSVILSLISFQKKKIKKNRKKFIVGKPLEQNGLTMAQKMPKYII